MSSNSMRPILEGPDVAHGITCYRRGCGCAVGRRANSDAVKAWRDRRREQQSGRPPKLSVVRVPVAAPAKPKAVDEREIGAVEQALADELDRLPSGVPMASVYGAMALRAARVVDGARDDTSSAAMTKLESILKLLRPPVAGKGAADAPAETPEEQRKRLMYERLSAPLVGVASVRDT